MDLSFELTLLSLSLENRGNIRNVKELEIVLKSTEM